MGDGYVTATMAGLRAALVADPVLAALVDGRVVDEPRQGIAFPYVRFGRLEPVPDDTDHTEGAIVQVGLEVYSRPLSGRVEAARICEAIQAALHRKPGGVAVAGFQVCDVVVQTWAVDRGKDGATYEGRLALEVHLDA
ncbi:DUF3168 domain-containing protein [Phaeobacter gallaeciensis]|uniref:DUF3168 domain-containing protein n=1 Tax=Phaeobacter gallaeciensis TaxID=60890 RepID=UPI00237FA569|nr:DUF3168 domain-containing protein [Phaeobacter gallaeciensis]MDE4059770.1 DUF3168 domain-containing protein [Phaeobacter gallaeciensis]MDE4122593.1 DUF3168 domain-containing protein [Phaeobacter gallaeciensis]MDE4127258.1 DUF3168 domain-containing protein [Phaeobacter gallaeciensis]